MDRNDKYGDIFAANFFPGRALLRRSKENENFTIPKILGHKKSLACDEKHIKRYF